MKCPVLSHPWVCKTLAIIYYGTWLGAEQCLDSLKETLLLIFSNMFFAAQGAGQTGGRHLFRHLFISKAPQTHTKIIQMHEWLHG